MANCALLVMDVQNGIVERLADHSRPLLSAIDRATVAARGAGVTVIYVRIAFRPGAPDVSSQNKGFAALASNTSLGVDDSWTQIHPAVAPLEGDVVVLKKRVSAFTGSDLDVVLRSLKVTSLVLAGISTSGVVLSTLRQAADLDYEITVLRDGCADADPLVHEVLMDKVFPRQASVVTTDVWVNHVLGRRVEESP